MRLPRVLLPRRYRPLVAVPGHERYSGEISRSLDEWAFSWYDDEGEEAVRRSLALLQPYLTERQFGRYVASDYGRCFMVIRSSRSPSGDILISDRYTFQAQTSRAGEFEKKVFWYYYCTYMEPRDPPPDRLLTKLLMARTQPELLLAPPRAFRQTVHGYGSVAEFVASMDAILL